MSPDQWITLVGAVAAVCTTVAFVPQIVRVRRQGGRAWKDVSDGGIDPTRGYFVRLPSGRRIDVFFYDGPISLAVAINGAPRHTRSNNSRRVTRECG